MLSKLQSLLAAHHLSGYLVTDFRGSSLTLPRLLPPAASEKRWTTRRVGLAIPATGKPVLLVSAIDEGQFPSSKYPDLDIRVYVSWGQWQTLLREVVARCPRLAMDYSPGCALPVISNADAGTVEFMRAAGAEVVSSADLMQEALAVWSAEAISGHARASELVNATKDQAMALMRDALAAGRELCEHEVAEFILRRFAEQGLESRDCPVVACNEHAADPHFEPTAARRTVIRKGDLVLIDLWARLPGEEHIFSDITWMAIAGVPTDRQLFVYNAVRDARDASLKAAQDGWAAGRTVRGFELDDAARHLIEGHGLTTGIKHRTGHSLSPGQLVHGVGMNLDNLETHDTRVMLPGTGFTIEPGCYLMSERIGVRSEINIFVDPAKGPVVTSGVQRELIRLA
jgi:Xaa-Pro dipeptidase